MRPYPSNDYLLWIIACARPIVWLIGGILVWWYSSRVPRLKFPMKFCAWGFIAFSAFSFISESAVLKAPWHPPSWMIVVNSVISIPAAFATVGGLVFACANAFRLQREDEERWRDITK